MTRLRAAAVLAIVVALSTAPASAQTAGDPEYSVPLADLEAALDCDEFTHRDKEPVLLVHGTFTNGHEQWDWNYAILLRETGHDVCIVTYPDRGSGDMQISAEYVAYAVKAIHQRSGSDVDMVGHSQGGLMPRWAIKWWPSVRAALDDVVLLAGPNHGIGMYGDGSLPAAMPAVFWQFSPNSNFIRALNAGDETPGTIDYTQIYSDHDELVRPVDPPTAALDLGEEGPNVVNIRTQDVCPFRVVDHASIGLTDVLTQRLVLDAIDHVGPTDVERAEVDEILCNLPDQYVVPGTFPNLAAQFQRSFSGGFPEWETVSEEPPLRDYAVATAPDEPAPAAPTAPPQADGDTEAATARVPNRDALPATGRTIPILAVGIAIGVALLLRLGKSKLDD